MTNLGLVDTATLLGLELILTVTLEIFQLVRIRTDTVLGADAQRLKPGDVADIRELTSGLIKARQVNSEFMQSRVDDAVESLVRVLIEIGSGRAAYELSPGGIFYTEVDFIAEAKNRARVTSFVDASKYWTSAHGGSSLTQNRAAIGRGVRITRIFIEDQERLEDIRPVVEEHHAAGVECRVAIRTQIPPTCLRDYAIIDDGSLAVVLDLDDKRMPTVTRFITAATEIGRGEIRRLEDIHRVLTQRSMSAAEFLGEERRAT
ncbi:hypothetical protein [Actinoplanes sp. NPDC026619]|uniref:hypothetical protein n=1 Tax=Actinoplanes sp. NPDC026619 TaxID=3155798 RepID=UPI0034111263